MRMTHTLLQVAIALMAEPTAKHWGYSLSKISGLRSGVLYPILNRMLSEGWLHDGWEDPSDDRKRPPRRYYVITEDGLRELGAVLRRAEIEAQRSTQGRLALS